MLVAIRFYLMQMLKMMSLGCNTVLATTNDTSAYFCASFSCNFLPFFFNALLQLRICFRLVPVNSVFQYIPEKKIWRGHVRRSSRSLNRTSTPYPPIGKMIVEPVADLGRVMRRCAVLLEINLVNILALRYHWPHFFFQHCQIRIISDCSLEEEWPNHTETAYATPDSDSRYIDFFFKYLTWICLTPIHTVVPIYMTVYLESRFVRPNDLINDFSRVLVKL